MNCLPDLPPTFKKCTFDICWHFAVSMNYKLKISAGKVFRSNLRNVFLLSKKKAINYNVHIHLFANLCRKVSVKFRSIIFVIDLQWKAKQGDSSLLSEPPPLNLERQHLLLDIFTFWSIKIAHSLTKWSVPLKIALMNWLFETWTR